MARLAQVRRAPVAGKCQKKVGIRNVVLQGRITKPSCKRPSRKPSYPKQPSPKRTKLEEPSISISGFDPASVPKTPAWKKKDFQLINEIGSGGFSEVYLAKNKSRREPRNTVVLKIMTYTPINNLKLEDALAEYSVHQPLNHPNITSAYGYMSTKKHFTLIMEYCDKGDLHDYIYEDEKSHPRGFERTRSYIRQLVSAVEYLQTTHKVIHMDIKPENVLVTSRDTVMLTDFGCCVKITGNPRAVHKHSNYNGGTLMYHPPELLRVERIFDSTADVWAIGCLTYIMLDKEGEHPYFQHDPFKSKEAKKAQMNQALWSMTRMKGGNFKEEGFLAMESLAKDFIRLTIGRDRKDRPLISQLWKSKFLSQEK